MRFILVHQWKEFFRSNVWQKNLAINVLMGIFFLYLAANFIFLSYIAGEILMDVFPGESPIENFNKGILYYFMVDLFIRFYMQQSPVLSITPYLHLPIKKSKMMNLVMVRSMFSIFNTSVLLLSIPFALGWIAPYESVSGAFFWIASIFCFNLVNNYLVIYLKKALMEKPSIVGIFGGLIIVLGAIDYLGYIQISGISELFFTGVIYTPALALIPVILLLSVYAFVFQYFKSRAYIEGLGKLKSKKARSTSIAFLEPLAEIGKLIEVELKLIWRNKRPRSVILISVFFVLYGYFLYPNSTNAFSYILFGLIITGMPLLNYGQFLFSWESGHFDLLLARNVTFKKYILGKFYLFTAATLTMFILSLIYIPYGARVLWFNLAMALFNMGITFWVVFYFSSLNPKKIDLSQSTFFNYQGTSYQQFILFIPVMGLPILVFSPFHVLISEEAGLIALGVLGVLGLLLKGPISRIMETRINTKKHQLATNFRA